MSSSKRSRLPEHVDHYHVDVFVGEERSYFRGLVLINEGADSEEGRGDGWTIIDDSGVLGEHDRRLGERLPLREAIRQALALLRDALGPSISPIWGTAPYDLLGYRGPPSPVKWIEFGWNRLPWPRRGTSPRAPERVGEDGLPAGEE